MKMKKVIKLKTQNKEKSQNGIKLKNSKCENWKTEIVTKLKKKSMFLSLNKHFVSLKKIVYKTKKKNQIVQN